MFDFGGTLLAGYDPARSARLYVRIFRKHDINIPVKRAHAVREQEFLKHMKAHYRKADQHGRYHMLMNRVLSRFGHHVSEKQLHAMAHEYSEEMEKHYRLFPGTKRVLSLLKKRGFKLALVCNGSVKWTYDHLRRFGIENYFDAIVISEAVKKEKSDLVPFRVALEKLNAKPLECLMIGDRLDEDMYAKKLGILTCHAAYAEQVPPIGKTIKPDFVLRDIRKLPRLIASLSR